jgi:hypothetical protein
MRQLEPVTCAVPRTSEPISLGHFIAGDTISVSFTELRERIDARCRQCRVGVGFMPAATISEPVRATPILQARPRVGAVHRDGRFSPRKACRCAACTTRCNDPTPMRRSPCIESC